MIFELTFKHFWLICMVVMAMNAGIWHWRSRSHIARDPSLAGGYRKLIGGMVPYGDIPWVVMGVGSVFLLWIMGTWWLFVRGGAETMLRHRIHARTA